MGKPQRVVNERDVNWIEEGKGDRIRFRRKRLAAEAGSELLGCTLVELEPGRRSWPYHFHHGNEEAIYVLDGDGDIRLAGRKIPISKGTYIALPRGESGAHQVHNTSSETLRFLIVSTMRHPDIISYPDSKKVGLFAGSAPGGSKQERTLTGYVPSSAEVDYWYGEE